MHLNASKYMQNELCKSFVHEIIKEVVSITHKQIKIDNFPSKDSTFCSKQLLALKYKKSKWAYSEKKTGNISGELQFISIWLTPEFQKLP